MRGRLVVNQAFNFENRVSADWCEYVDMPSTIDGEGSIRIDRAKAAFHVSAKKMIYYMYYPSRDHLSLHLGSP